MSSSGSHLRQISRRNFLKTAAYAPVLFLPAPFYGSHHRAGLLQLGFPIPSQTADLSFTPHYPASSPLDEMLRCVPPGADQFVTEKYAAEIEDAFGEWGRRLSSSPLGTSPHEIFAEPSLRASSLLPLSERIVRDRFGIQVIQRQFETSLDLDHNRFLDQLREYFAPFARMNSTEFQITSIHREGTTDPVLIGADIRYGIAGEIPTGGCEQRIGLWRTKWVQHGDQWVVVEFQVLQETITRAKAPLFADLSEQAFARASSYKEQLLRGSDYWRTVLDAASGIDVYGNQGITVGDFDGDGYDDIYICQPAGLPNRLYRNRGDGSFDDVSERAGVDVLDSTSCALFADFENRGIQDLLVVTTAGPLLFVNEGGKFSRKADAFKFAHPPQGAFTHAAIADYDRDGLLDIYFCVYNYYSGLGQYRYPSPYYDARNGPPNFLFRNEGGWRFVDRTEAAGLSVDNDRYTFACAWGDHSGNSLPDLYVANDFGRSNLYRNNGDGTFTSISSQAGTDDVGAGMSACWFDFDGDGNQDIYVANMWSAAGLRVSAQPQFHERDPENTRALYRHHARGNSLYRNLGDGKFRSVAAETGTEFGRWAWSSDAFDFDHDGYPDLYIANGYVSAQDREDVASFFWRQVVGNSPRELSPAPNYETAWNAINELIRSDHTWSGYERNILYCNNHDGTFSDLSGISGLDLPEDSRAFALADLDHDGRLEVLLKNRNAPQLRLLHNVMADIGNSVVLRLRGTKSNRDAIGAAVTVEARGQKQRKYVQAGSGFLSQHTKELLFGVGEETNSVRATVRWPSEVVQTFDRIPVNHRTEIIEGSDNLQSAAFAKFSSTPVPRSEPGRPESLPTTVATWLLQPLHAPGFSLKDTSGTAWDLDSIAGNRLLIFWSTASKESREQLHLLKQVPANLHVLALNVDQSQDGASVRVFADKEQLPFPLLLATMEIAGIYNILSRYLFDRHRDLDLPVSFLLDERGMIVKVYRGVVRAEQIASDVASVPQTSSERIKQALPFPGTLHSGEFQRNDFTYGVVFFQHGYLDAATDAFLQVIATKPDDAEAHYNLGTLYLRRDDLPAARTHLEKALQLKPQYAEAWNNLGMAAAQQGNAEEAVKDFKQSLALRPDYSVALLNLGNLYRHRREFADAEQTLNRALKANPDDPETNYSVAMLYAQQDDPVRAEQGFQRAIALKPGYADALNNFGVLLVREQRYSDAELKFQTCIQNNPEFDQAYLNLARLYALLDQKEKARETLRALLQRQPQHAVALQSLKMLQ